MRKLRLPIPPRHLARCSSSRAQLQMARVCRVPGAHRPAPSLFSYPGLSALPYHSRQAEPFARWVSRLEAATPEITEEYLRLREGGAPNDFEDSGSEEGALHSGGWHWASLIDRGRVREDTWQRCPVTTAVLSSIPGLCVGDMPFAFAFFSTLAPGSKIAAHTSPCNLRLRVHLPLLVPEPETCGMSVAGVETHWRTGECTIFDDSFEHHVWNNGTQPRVLLLFDLWHHDLSAAEIAAIEEMFREVEARGEKRRGAKSD